MTHHARPEMSSQMKILLRRLRMSFSGTTVAY
jgi:hypothetical protein